MIDGISLFLRVKEYIDAKSRGGGIGGSGESGTGMLSLEI